MANSTQSKVSKLIEWSLGIIGVLMLATLLPVFSNQNACACTDKNAEAKSYVGTLSRTQVVFFSEKNRFAASITELAADSPSDTKNYTYSVESYSNRAFVFGKTKNPELKSYVSGVFVSPTNKNTSTMIICQAKEPGVTPIGPPIDAQTCGEGTVNAIELR
jgi:type IV pilus assembly protein PilA